MNHLRLGTVFESPGKVELVCCSSAQVWTMTLLLSLPAVSDTQVFN